MSLSIYIIRTQVQTTAPLKTSTRTQGTLPPTRSMPVWTAAITGPMTSAQKQTMMTRTKTPIGAQLTTGVRNVARPRTFNDECTDQTTRTRTMLMVAVWQTTRATIAAHPTTRVMNTARPILTRVRIAACLVPRAQTRVVVRCAARRRTQAADNNVNVVQRSGSGTKQMQPVNRKTDRGKPASGKCLHLCGLVLNSMFAPQTTAGS
jgi:hypothetical protein